MSNTSKRSCLYARQQWIASQTQHVKTDQDDARMLVETCRLGTYRSLLTRTATSARNWAVRDALVRTRTRYIVLAKALVWRDRL